MAGLKNYFSLIEIVLWLSSVILILGSFFVFGGSSTMAMIASLIGVTAIIFNAKGNPFGQFLMVIFSFMYFIISYSFSYYGEMITYLGMTMPMALFALIAWLRNPYKGKHSEVEVNSISRKEVAGMFVACLLVTIIFYFILKYFHTANLIFSTLSISSSFVAVYLTFRRNSYFSLAYAFNDIVLIILWLLASIEDIKYASVLVCFVAFLANDIYAFLSWKKMEVRQAAGE